MSRDKIAKSAETFYPVNIKLKGKRVLVCGGTQAALRETSRLIDFGADVEVVAPHMVAELQDLSVTYGERVKLHRRAFGDTDVKALNAGAYALAFAYAKDPSENARVAEFANGSKTPVCVIDDTSKSDYIVPSIIKRGHLKIGISTDAISHPLERALVQRIEAIFVSEIDNYSLFLTSMQELVASIATDEELGQPAVSSMLMRRLAESEEIQLALQRKNFEEANHLARALVAQIRSQSSEPIVAE